jgi:hypothetical protein
MNNTSERGAQGGRSKPLTGTSGKGSERSSLGTGAQTLGPMGQPAGAMKEQVGAVAESTKDLASKAGEKVVNAVEEQKVAGADFVSDVASSIRRAASEFNQIPQAAQYMRLAADQVDSASEAFRRRDLNQLVSDVRDFARRQPTAFFGAAILAGFAVVRFLKTSTGENASKTSESHHRSTGSESMLDTPLQPSAGNFSQTGM